MSVDSVFDAYWKEEVEDSVSGYSSLSEEAGDVFLDKEKQKGEITKCVTQNLKITRLVKISGSDGIMDKLLKYGGSGSYMAGENCPQVMERGHIVNIFKKGDK